MTIHSYLPQDRLRALANETTLPDRTSGSALFADISGFTALTESLREALGARKGAEELSKRLGEVYSALITEVEKYGGSVIGFAGDAMMCWFDSGNDESQASFSYALSAAMGMQSAIHEFPALALKVSIASGNARRFVVGDEEIQRIDALAGATVARTATGEHLANKGDVLVDEATTMLLGNSLVIKEWREDGESKEKFAIVNKSDWQSNLRDLQQPETITPVMQALRPYVHHAVYERETSGKGSFLTEFRPCVALFIRFTGIDYDSDSAEAELDDFIRAVQATASRYEGTLMDITIGDKGSYAYVNFGALSAHEDDSRRAVKAALELRNKTELQLQMGITQGLMRVGAYGGETRKVFGALGDDVNLAARLMTTAKKNEILLSSHVHKAVLDQFTFEPRPPLQIKGKAEPLPVFAVTGESQKRAVRLQEPDYSLPMVGRQQELGIINDKLDAAAKGQGQVVGIVAEAGLGKSRLVAEVIRNARRKGFVGFGGACQSDGIHTPYLAWKSIWQAFFDVDPEMSERKLMRWLEGEIEDRAPLRVDAMPLLNAVLELNIPENNFTQYLEPKIRQSALHALLEDCLKAQAGDEPTLIVIEDLHWIDALSHDLLEGLAKALAHHAVCFVLAYRPPQIERLQSPRLEVLPQFTRIELPELTKAEAESAIRAKLAQLYPARSGTLPVGLVDTVMGRAQGNPFYLEELLNYVRDRGLDPSDIQNIELPDSLHTLILSRIDQLSEQEKTTLRVASIVGRLFRAAWLNGYYPELGSFPQVKAVLDQLDTLDITPLDSEPELTYLFKHIVTHEVTYESLPYATRARLHEQLAKYLENADASVDAIAFHYGRSENKEKQREYLRKAGEAAQKNFANAAALEYYGKLLPLFKDMEEHANEKIQIYLQSGQALEFMGRYDEAEDDYRAALELAQDNAALKANAQFVLGKLNRWRGDYGVALAWLAQARAVYTALNDTTRLTQILIETGLVLLRKGEYTQARDPLNEGLTLAREAGDKMSIAQALYTLGVLTFNYTQKRSLYEESLSLRREMGDKLGISASLHSLGTIAHSQGNYTAARELYEESLMLKREMGDKWGIALSIGNLGLITYAQGNLVAARALFEETLALKREMGTKQGIANSLGDLGNIALMYGDTNTAQALYEESLAISREMANQVGIATSLGDLGTLALAQGDTRAARVLFEESLVLNRKIEDTFGIAKSLNDLGNVVLARGDTIAAHAMNEESSMLCKEMGEKSLMAYVLLSSGLVALAESDNLGAREYILHSLRLRQEMGERLQQTSSLIGVAKLTLQEGNPRGAAQLLGATQAALKTLNVVVAPEMKFCHTQTLAEVKEVLGEAAFQSAWEEGSQWSLEEAVKRALE